MRAVLFLISVAVLAPARAAVPAANRPPYDAKLAPLDPLSWELLKDSGYELREDWKVWDKIGDAAVAREEMPYLLSRLGSARRLKALLQLNMIFNRYEGKRSKLSPEDRDLVRDIVRKHWAVFGVGPRRELRSYFLKEELVEMDKVPLRLDAGASPLSMRDPEPSPASDEPLPSAEAAAAAVPASVTALPPPSPAPAPESASASAYIFRPTPVLTPLLEPLSLRRPSPFVKNVPKAAVAAVPAAPVAPAAMLPAPPAAVVAPPPAGAPTVVAAPTPAAAPARAAATAAAPAPPAPSASAAPVSAAALAAVPGGFVRPIPAKPMAPGAASPAAPTPIAKAPAAPIPAPPAVALSTGSDLGSFKPWTPPAAPAPTPAATPSAAEPARANVVSAAEFEAFVEQGPYGREGKALLLLAAKKSPEFAQPLLRRTVVAAVPQIVFDGARAGGGLRAGRETAGTGALIALSQGPVFLERKKGFFGGRQALLLPESPAAWADLGVPMPALQALRKDAAPAGSQESDWGTTKVYADDSRRGAYFPQQQAGELLEQLLLLGLEREGLASSGYAARRWARTARLLFSLRLKEEIGQDAFLDPDRREELRDWVERAEENDDLTAAVWSSARGRVLDPRRGPPDSAREYEARARSSCVRAALEDGLAEAARRRAARVGALEGLLEAGVVDGDAARASAQAAADEEKEARRKLLLAPPACPPADPAREAGLRKAALLLAESTRAERAVREQRAKGDGHAR